MEPKLKRVCAMIGQGCNLRCRMCPNLERFETLQPKEMPIDRIIDIIRQAADAGAVEFRPHSLGEPTLHSDFGRVCGAAAIYGLYLRLDATNGSKLADLSAGCLQAIQTNPAGATIVVSIEGGSRETYEWIRRGASWDVLWAGLRGAANFWVNAQRLTLACRCVLMHRNADELEQLVVRLADHRFNLFQLVHLQETAAFPGESMQDEREETMAVSQRVRAACESAGMRYDPLVERTFDTKIGCRERTVGRACIAPYDSMRINIRGNASPCIQLDGKGVFAGNVSDASVGELFESDLYTRLRTEFDAGRIPSECSSCVMFQSRDPK